MQCNEQILRVVKISKNINSDKLEKGFKEEDRKSVV